MTADPERTSVPTVRIGTARNSNLGDRRQQRGEIGEIFDQWP